MVDAKKWAYSVLKLADGSSRGDILQKWKEGVLKWHPDKFPHLKNDNVKLEKVKLNFMVFDNAKKILLGRESQQKEAEKWLRREISKENKKTPPSSSHPSSSGKSAGWKAAEMRHFQRMMSQTCDKLTKEDVIEILKYLGKTFSYDMSKAELCKLAGIKAGVKRASTTGKKKTPAKPKSAISACGGRTKQDLFDILGRNPKLNEKVKSNMSKKQLCELAGFVY